MVPNIEELGGRGQECVWFLKDLGFLQYSEQWSFQTIEGLCSK